MGREVRMVPADWKHPKNEKGNFIPLYRGAMPSEQPSGMRNMPSGKPASGAATAKARHGRRAPLTKPADTPTMLAPARRPMTTCRHGPKVSLKTPEELARWLADTNASAFGNDGASYEAWLRVCRGGFAPSMVIENGRIQSGVEALKDAS